MPQQVLKPFALLLMVAAVLAAGCSGASGGDGSGGGAATGDAQEVRVTLSEFAIASTITEFQAGNVYRFIVENRGAVPHEWVMMEGAGGGMAGMGHDMAHMHVAAEITQSELPAGAVVTREFTLREAGRFEFACHLPGHYEAGMALPVVVG